MNVPFVDLKAQYESLKEEIDPAIQKVIDGSDFILGKEVENFENNFAKFCNAKYCIGVGSGTSALTLSLLALGIKKGDEVIVPSNTFIATAFSVSLVGAKPVFTDINENSFNINISKVSAAINAKTKAIIPVHLYGQPVDMEPIIKIASDNNINIIEDACQAHGAEYKGKRVGVFSDIGCFSFYPAKNLGAFGDAGAVVTNNKEMAENVKMLREYGQKIKHHHLMKGFNTRLDTIQAAVLGVKLRYLERWNELRRENAKLYSSLLNGMEIRLPIEEEFAKHVYHLFVIRTQKRNELQKFLKEKGISTGIHYPTPIHLQKAYSEFGNIEGSMPVAEKVSKEILSLPMYPELDKEQIRYVVDSIKSFYKNG